MKPLDLPNIDKWVVMHIEAQRAASNSAAVLRLLHGRVSTSAEASRIINRKTRERNKS